MKATELRQKNPEELKSLLLDLLREQFNLRMQKGSGHEYTLELVAVDRPVATDEYDADRATVLLPEGNRYIYEPTVARDKARLSALDHLLTTFFDGSAADVVAALIESRRSELTPGELEELSNMIAKTRKEGR